MNAIKSSLVDPQQCFKRLAFMYELQKNGLAFKITIQILNQICNLNIQIFENVLKILKNYMF